MVLLPRVLRHKPCFIMTTAHPPTYRFPIDNDRVNYVRSVMVLTNAIFKNDTITIMVIIIANKLPIVRELGAYCVIAVQNDAMNRTDILISVFSKLNRGYKKSKISTL